MWPPKSAQELIGEHEGTCRVPYRDSRGYPTCGIGHKLADNKDIPLAQFPVATDGQISTWFVRDVGQATQDCECLFGSAWATMGDARRAAFLDMCFQIGGAGLSRFPKMLAAVMAGNWKVAADEASASRWDEQTPHRAAHDEALILIGDWSALH